MKMLFAIVAVMLNMLVPAFAIDFSTNITALDGTPLEDNNGKPYETTLAQIVENALLATYKDEPELSGDDKIARYALALKIHNQKNVDLSPEETVLVKKLIAKSYGPLIVGQAWKVLNAK